MITRLTTLPMTGPTLRRAGGKWAAALLTLLFAGCLTAVSDPPAHRMARLQQIAGTYDNRPKAYLIQELFKPDHWVEAEVPDQFLTMLAETLGLGPEPREAKRFDTVRISVPRDDTLVFEALSHGTVAASRRLTRGKDFDFTEGHVRLAENRSTTGAVEPQVFYIGRLKEWVELYLREDGDLQLREIGEEKAMLFLLIPSGMSQDTQRIYPRR